MAARFPAHRALSRDVWLPLAAAAVLVAVLSILKRSAAAISVAQAGTVLAIFGLGGALLGMDEQISARGVLLRTEINVRAIPGDMLFVHDLSRGIGYGLNFYLRRELPPWRGSGGFVFTSLEGEKKLIEAGYSCPQALFPPAAILCSRAPLSNSPPLR
jgi:hypothetical protein